MDEINRLENDFLFASLCRCPFALQWHRLSLAIAATSIMSMDQLHGRSPLLLWLRITFGSTDFNVIKIKWRTTNRLTEASRVSPFLRLRGSDAPKLTRTLLSRRWNGEKEIKAISIGKNGKIWNFRFVFPPDGDWFRPIMVMISRTEPFNASHL